MVGVGFILIISGFFYVGKLVFCVLGGDCVDFGFGGFGGDLWYWLGVVVYFFGFECGWCLWFGVVVVCGVV